MPKNYSIVRMVQEHGNLKVGMIVQMPRHRALKLVNKGFAVPYEIIIKKSKKSTKKDK